MTWAGMKVQQLLPMVIDMGVRGATGTRAEDGQWRISSHGPFSKENGYVESGVT